MKLCWHSLCWVFMCVLRSKNLFVCFGSKPKSVFVRLFYFYHPHSFIFWGCEEMCNTPSRKWGKKTLDESLAISLTTLIQSGVGWWYHRCHNKKYCKIFFIHSVAFIIRKYVKIFKIIEISVKYFLITVLISWKQTQIPFRFLRKLQNKKEIAFRNK